MFRTNSPGSTVDGHFTNGNPATGTPATVVDAPWLNMVQDELENVLVAAGIAPNQANSGQLLASIQALLGLVPGNRNALINSDFIVSQRGAISNVGNTYGTGPGRYTVDRWFQGADVGAGTGAASTQRGTFSVGQTAVPGDPLYFLHHQQTAASSAGAPTILQKIESVRGWTNKTATFQVWLKAASAISVTARVTQNFGTGGSPSSPVVAGSAVFAVTTSWQLFTVTVTLASIAGKTLGTAGNDHLLVELVLPNAATFTLDVARPQFEAGSQASSFEPRPLADEIALCRRYYEKSYELTTDPATDTQLGATRFYVQTGSAQPLCMADVETRFLVEKRAIPAITWYGFLTFNQAGQLWSGAGGFTVTGTNSPSKRCTGHPSVTSGATASNTVAGGHWTAEAEL